MTQENQGIARRDLLKVAAAGATFAPVLGSIFAVQAYGAETKVKAGDSKSKAAGEEFADDRLVKASDPVATALKYVEDHSKAKDVKEKQGVKPEGQKCSACMLFTSKGHLKNGSEVGQCTLISSGLVKANGYCNSWAKKV